MPEKDRTDWANLEQARDQAACSAAKALHAGRLAEAKRYAATYAESVESLNGLWYSADLTPQTSDSGETPETFTPEALEALPLGTVILADIPEPRIVGSKTPPPVRRGVALERTTSPVRDSTTGAPERPAFRGFNGARYGREWFASFTNVRIVHTPEAPS